MKQISLKILLAFLANLFIVGCSMKSQYYILSNPSEVKHHQKLPGVIIGVEQVEVPEYLMNDKIAISDNSSKVRFLSDVQWAEDIDKGITRRMIAFLQKRFEQPHVYSYPWDTDRQPDIKVKVQISRFIAQGDKVYLDAAWEVKDMNHGRSVANLFHKEIATDATPQGIVSAMDKSLKYLEEDIAHAIAQLR